MFDFKGRAEEAAEYAASVERQFARKEAERIERLRDEFAMAALTGYLAHYGADAPFDVRSDSYLIADAMMEARK